MGCVTGIGNVFPKSVVRLYDLWSAGKMEEARALQAKVAVAEGACKKGLAATKWGAAHFVGPGVGIEGTAAFAMRKPYRSAGREVRESTVETMGVLVEVERGLPDRVMYSQANGSK